MGNNFTNLATAAKWLLKALILKQYFYAALLMSWIFSLSLSPPCFFSLSLPCFLSLSLPCFLSLSLFHVLSLSSLYGPILFLITPTLFLYLLLPPVSPISGLLSSFTNTIKIQLQSLFISYFLDRNFTPIVWKYNQSAKCKYFSTHNIIFAFLIKGT